MCFSFRRGQLLIGAICFFFFGCCHFFRGNRWCGVVVKIFWSTRWFLKIFFSQKNGV